MTMGQCIVRMFSGVGRGNVFCGVSIMHSKYVMIIM